MLIEVPQEDHRYILKWLVVVVWACLLEAFDDYGKYSLTDHALLIYEAYVNIVECVLYEFQLLTLKWQKLARATGKQRRLCNVVPLISYAAVPDGAAA